MSESKYCENCENYSETIYFGEFRCRKHIIDLSEGSVDANTCTDYKEAK